MFNISPHIYLYITYIIVIIYSMASSLPDNPHTTCPICLEDMLVKTPRALPCLHTFCESCIQALLSRNKGSTDIRCPICKQLTRIPSGRVEDIPKNFYLQRPQSETSSYLCAMCKIKATQKCNTCSLTLCKSCSQHHLSHRLFNNHKITDISSYMCRIHTKPIEFICKTCQCDLCIVCVHMEEHMKHQKSIIDHNEAQDTIIQRAQENISSVVPKMQKYISKLVDATEQLDFVFDEISRLAVVLQRKVAQEVGRLRNIVKKYQSEMNQRLDNTKTSMSKLTKMGQDLIQSKYTGSSTVEIAKDKKKIEQTIKELNKICCDKIKTYRLEEVNVDSLQVAQLHLYELVDLRETVKGDANVIKPDIPDDLHSLQTLIFNLEAVKNSSKLKKDHATEILTEAMEWCNSNKVNFNILNKTVCVIKQYS